MTTTTSGMHPAEAAPPGATDPRLPRSVRLFVSAVVAAGLASVAVRIPEALRWTRTELLAALILALTTTVAEQFPTRLRHRTESEDFSLTDSLWAAILLLAKPGILTFAVVVGVGVGQALRRLAAIKVAFNVGQLVLAVTAAQAVVTALGRPRSFEPRAVAAVALGMLVFLVVNTSLTALVIALVEGELFRRVFLSPALLNVAHWAGNLALGLLGALVWNSDPWAIPLVAALAVPCYLAYRSWVLAFHDPQKLPEAPTAGP